MGILSVDFNNINLYDDHYDKEDPETIIHVTFMACHNRLKQCKAPKKDISKKLMPVAWHPRRWWD